MMPSPQSENDPAFRDFFRRRTPAVITEPGVFDIAHTAFEWLVTGPHPVALDGRPIPGLPTRLVPLDELGSLLLDKDAPQSLRDAAWAALVTRSRADGGTWTVACVGLALPWLVQVAARLTRSAQGEAHDIQAAVVTGFLEELTTVDLDRPRILVRLRWSAYRAGCAALRETLHAASPVGDASDEQMQELLAECAVPVSGFRSCPPPEPSAHPELALFAAVDAGVISAQEATLISATRFGELSLAEAAHARGQTYEAAKKTRQRAESRLAAHLKTATAPDALDLPPASAPPTSSRLRTVTGRGPTSAREQRRPVVANAPNSGPGDREPRLRAAPQQRRPAARPDTAREALSCD
ncbi:sigma-70 family RNA polymerase sigma factor [Amycolatopsis sp. NPDC051758]|uniref:sigma-70 family RNA polymerase sigma factor n=1 Tax=Amycolatopsis sp. NPDC051758 TaxID=3363935 RepID=UPI0037BBC059